MAGFLGRLQRRSRKSRSATVDLVLRDPAEVAQEEGAEQTSSTTIVSTADDLGNSHSLLSRLQNEPGVAKGSSTTTLNAKAQSKKGSIFGEEMPWWLTEPVKPSAQVDLLVPAARLALNDFISENTSPDALRLAIRRAVKIASERLSSEVRFAARDLQEATKDLSGLLLGKGPLQPLFDDGAVTDIYLDGHASIKCLRAGQALETPFRFRNVSEYEAYISSMLQSVERVLNHNSPIVDCVLHDEWRSRVNALHASLRDGRESSLVIRIPRLRQVSFYDLLRMKTLPATLAAWLAELVTCGQANMLVIGPTGAGKTTLTSALLSSVGSDERVCTIEEVPELFVGSNHVEKLVSRPENSHGTGAVELHELLRAALHRAPHRIVVGEIRDKEGVLFLQALETGHAGSVATIHADSAVDGLWRLMDLVASKESAPQESIQRRIARSLHVLITLKKIDGRPCLMEVAEVCPPKNGEFIVRPLVAFEGIVNNRRQWRIQSIDSVWIRHLAGRGMQLSPGPQLLAPKPPKDEGPHEVSW